MGLLKLKPFCEMLKIDIIFNHTGFMKVRCGLMTASEVARQLGVSRKTYYKWEQRGQTALLEGLSDHSAGRPEKDDSPVQAALE